MSNIVAGIGRGQLLHVDEHHTLKKAIYDRYKEGLKNLPIQMNPYMECSEPNFWLSCLTINVDAMTYITPEKIRLALNNENIESRPIWKPMHLQPVYANQDYITTNDEDVSTDIFTRGLCLPSDIKLTIKQQSEVIKIIQSCFF
jgi:dTDP-4-amino-4,6-dideoxygalactose transaminase